MLERKIRVNWSTRSKVRQPLSARLADGFGSIAACAAWPLSAAPATDADGRIDPPVGSRVSLRGQDSRHGLVTNWRTNMVPKNTICLWYDGSALDAAKFYAETFPDSAVGAVLHAPGDYPAGQQGNVLTVEFRVIGIPCLGLNGGPAFRHNEAFSFQVAT